MDVGIYCKPTIMVQCENVRNIMMTYSVYIRFIVTIDYAYGCTFEKE